LIIRDLPVFKDYPWGKSAAELIRSSAQRRGKGVGEKGEKSFRYFRNDISSKSRWEGGSRAAGGGGTKKKGKSYSSFIATSQTYKGKRHAICVAGGQGKKGEIGGSGGSNKNEVKSIDLVGGRKKKGAVYLLWEEGRKGKMEIR